MWSAENSVLHSISSQHRQYGTRVRSSLIQAVTVPYADHATSRKSLNINPSTKTIRNKNRFQNIRKLEIILEKSAKPADVEKALGAYGRDSMESLQHGRGSIPIKNYIDLESESFQPGEMVAGYVSLLTTCPMNVSWVTLRLKGTYIVAYEGRVEGEAITSTEQITFLDQKTNVFEPDSGESFQEFASGSHQFNFEYQLPANIPSTMFFERFQTVYEGASVVYSIEAQLHLYDHGHGTDRVTYASPTAKEIIMVTRHLSEKCTEKYHRPFAITKTAHLGCCCYKFGAMSMGVSLKKVIFVEGEAVVIELQTMNDCKLKVKQIDVALVQYSSFKSSDMKQSALQARTTLVAQSIPMNSMGYGDVYNELVLTLPDEMQPSTSLNIRPPASRHSLSRPSDAIQMRVVEGDKTKQKTEAMPTIDVEDITLEQVKDELIDAPRLSRDYDKIYDITYYLQMKVRTNVEWFNMKGPEIHFPISIEACSQEAKSNRDSRLDERLKKMDEPDIDDLSEQVIDEAEAEIRPEVIPEDSTCDNGEEPSDEQK